MSICTLTRKLEAGIDSWPFCVYGGVRRRIMTKMDERPWRASRTLEMLTGTLEAEGKSLAFFRPWHDTVTENPNAIKVRRKVMKTKWWVLAVLSLSVVVVSVMAWESRVQATPQKELFVIKTPTLKNCGLAPWLVTDRLGYFTEEGIKIQYTGETQPALVIPSILRGDNDVSAAHPNSLAVAKAGGAKITGVVRGGIDPAPSVDPKYRHMWWFVNPAKYPNVKSFADLKKIPGKIKFSLITKNQCSDFLANRMLDKYGIPRDKIEWVTMPDIQAIQALRQGLVDVSGVHPPFYKGMQDARAAKIADSTDAGLGPAAGVGYYYFTDDFIKKNPKAVAGFVRAIKRGQRWANANPAKTAKWVEEVIGVPVTGNHYYAEDATIIESQNDAWIKDLEDHRVIPKGKVTSANLITHQFEAYGNYGRDKANPENTKKQKNKKNS
jgi:ABC-type nitrate/sulfonate/bicarbonate transport system substrate-binding protein